MSGAAITEEERLATEFVDIRVQNFSVLFLQVKQLVLKIVSWVLETYHPFDEGSLDLVDAIGKAKTDAMCVQSYRNYLLWIPMGRRAKIQGLYLYQEPAAQDKLDFAQTAYFGPEGTELLAQIKENLQQLGPDASFAEQADQAQQFLQQALGDEFDPEIFNTIQDALTLS